MEDELAALISDLVRPSRVDVVRAKHKLLEVLSDGQLHGGSDLLGHVARISGATSLDTADLHVDLPTGVDLHAIITAEQPPIAALKANVIGHEALAELYAEGVVVVLGGRPPGPDSRPRFGYRTPSMGSSVPVEAPRPALPGEVFVLTHRFRQPGVWHLEPDVFCADLAALDLDPRTERSLSEALDAYRRGVHLAAASLLGAAVEGAWFAAGQRLRGRSEQVNRLVDGHQTAGLQRAVADAIRAELPSSQRWEADGLMQHASLMRSIRNYGVHPRADADEGLEVYFDDERCGLLFLEAHRHLRRLAELVDNISPSS